MTQNKHMPAPWVNHFGTIYYKDKEIAQVKRPSTKSPVRHQIANAHLIASAPELLEVLETIEQEAKNQKGEGYEVIANLAKAAIAKARGE